ncbi:FAD-dependent oxidoreductase [Sphaerimonospora thailandensis]|uniref:FAD-binding protein n=1 Tax=Sphaerimonospora thailandensis TaxID=795644 RepID=A0A8J3W249_9ACTN|nr:FAD-dependent oxidoreductase [Sphaerimonospora thailandensis]GIH72421.1 FAD-binding protein [Sphaerimonospora thailandensis]
MPETDVIIIGSGAAGLTAALTAAGADLEVTVLEKSGLIGGTSAVSGGSIWAPVNRWLLKQGGHDSREDALAYLEAITLGNGDPDLLVAFTDNVNPMLEFVVKHTGIEFEVNPDHPDYQPHLPGAHTGGRTIQGGLFDSSQLPEPLRDRLRKSSSGVPITRLEVDTWGMDTLENWDWTLLADRMSKGIVGMGSALIGELLHGAVQRGAVVRTAAPARELVRDTAGRVCGVAVDGESGTRDILHARRGVVLASGGFEWNPDFVQRFLGRPMVAPASPPANTGDGLAMSIAIGAGLGNMSEAWWGPMIQPTGDSYDNAPLFRPTSSLRTLPGGLIVNARGRRFVNEAMNYNDMAKALANFDPVAYSYPNQPCWLVFDERFRKSYSVATCTPDSPTPNWMATASTLAELARTVGIDPDGLEHQVREFNSHAVRGEDPEFHRGESVYDTYRGDARVIPNRTLRPLEEGPYYAVPLLLGCLGTKGGPLTDASGQVIDIWGTPIPGLFACGNVAASAFGTGYPGAGATLAAGMTFGYLAGQALAAS